MESVPIIPVTFKNLPLIENKPAVIILVTFDQFNLNGKFHSIKPSYIRNGHHVSYLKKNVNNFPYINAKK